MPSKGEWELPRACGFCLPRWTAGPTGTGAVTELPTQQPLATGTVNVASVT